MKIHQLAVGELGTNCYIVATQKNNAMVIDAGGNAKGILQFLKENNLTLKLLLLTHAHYDHMGAVYELQQQTGAKVVLYKDEQEILLDPTKNVAIHFIEMNEFKPVQADVLLQDGDSVVLDEVTLQVIHTPGHTKGSCVYYTDGVMFSGDTLFQQSIGRTDLYSGNMNDMKASLKKLINLTEDYTVLPGHGNKTSLRYEKTTNPYMGTNYDDIF
ncbi:MBL fold metallo-hydrolase [Paludicola sp. MB14-C6]|uniref:MBL fold metallo-hydrolase n=1 Tax=Paludihabitans sp. MB14-C6 TaxID=3070656 RepID=UPI0027DC3B52|nr:MBL fold metallo-hydrolase [Paludicola sp. MB14-C6]WMJ22390.1 MBL fold metallo-hydrolase [Paludicola sp. MB14-C6]